MVLTNYVTTNHVNKHRSQIIETYFVLPYYAVRPQQIHLFLIKH